MQLDSIKSGCNFVRVLYQCATELEHLGHVPWKMFEVLARVKSLLQRPTVAILLLDAGMPQFHDFPMS